MFQRPLSAVLIYTLTLSAVGSLLMPSKVMAGDTQTKGAPRYRADAIIIKPKTGVSLRSVADLHSRFGTKASASFSRFGNMQVVELPNGLGVQQAIDGYFNSGLVDYAEPDYIVSIEQTQTVSNDLSANLWNLNNTGQNAGTVDADIDAPEAWSVRTDASIVTVGVIDTGIDYNHPDLNANMWRNPGEIAGDGIDNDNDGYIDNIHGINTVTGSGNPMDDNNHGTHVAGTIGAVGNNGIGSVGVAWNVKLMALKFIDATGTGSVSNAIKCIDFAIGKKVSVLNNSWGGGAYTQALYDAINRANSAGIVFVAAAGNSAADNDSLAFYPANYALPNVVPVGATDNKDALSTFSNYGYKTVELAAPGTSIFSTTPNNTYSTFSGTSMAAPHVSGAFALLKAHRTDLASVGALIGQILGTTDQLASLSNRTFTGGRLNLYRALTGTPKPVAHLLTSVDSGVPGVSVTFTDDSIGSIVSRSINFGDGTSSVLNGSVAHTYTSAGTYNAVLSVTGTDGSVVTRTKTIKVRANYSASSASYSWVSTTGLSSLILADDGVSPQVTLPFAFPYYGSTYQNIFISANGFITLGQSDMAAEYNNTALPYSATPNGAIYAYWDDLNPGAGGTVRHGNTTAGYVISWEGVPLVSDPAATVSFQMILTSAGGIKLQYQDVKPSSSLGGGKSATVGVEDEAGSMATQYCYNGSTLIGNLTAVSFSVPGSTPPKAPSGLSATAVSGSQINLAWTDNSTDETGFIVEYSLDNIKFLTAATTGANVKSYSHTNLPSGTRYYYRVKAVNSYGSSAYTSVASATTLVPPAAPSALSATAASASQVNLAWTDNSGNETGFKIERSTDNLTFAQIATVGAGVKTYAVTGLTATTAYYFRVRAYNSAGDSAYSNTASASTLAATLSAPSGLSASALSKSSIGLKWTDTNTAESGYKVERLIGKTWTQIGTVGANTTTYTDSGLAAATSYSYRVRAYTSSANSSYSSTASATTLR